MEDTGMAGMAGMSVEGLKKKFEEERLTLTYKQELLQRTIEDANRQLAAISREVCACDGALYALQEVKKLVAMQAPQMKPE